MPRKKRATAQDQDLLVKALEIDILEELTLGNVYMRLVTPTGKMVPYIQLWSSLSKQWGTLYRNRKDIDYIWSDWKKYADLHDKKQKNKRRKRSGV